MEISDLQALMQKLKRNKENQDLFSYEKMDIEVRVYVNNGWTNLSVDLSSGPVKNFIIHQSITSLKKEEEDVINEIRQIVNQNNKT